MTAVGFAPAPVLDGRPATWVWATTQAADVGALPVGCLVDHGDHTMLVVWVPHPASPRVLTLDSLTPLTVVELLVCSVCGAAGRIVDGAWAPEEA